MRRSTRTSVGAIAVLAAALAVGLLPTAGRAQTPLYFPRTQTLDTTAYTLRVAGADRYATAGALARVAAHHQRTDTGFPFNEPDATAITKSYGFGTCPRAVGIAAGDSVADALAAASVKDLGLLTTDSGDQVDTTGIDLLLTVSARQGGFQADLAAETLNNLNDLRDACGTFDILVFGGETAVPAPAFNALKALGDTTTRIVGTDRFDTARKVALAVHGVKGPTAVPLYTDPAAPTNLPAAVFLAEGFTGADALAVGPYLANKNIPILLTETGKLPEATRNALLAIHPQNVIVLGGPAAVSDDTAKAAKRAAGIAPPPEGEEETITRISGEDRYQTSIAIAQQLFNVQPCCDSVDPTGVVIPAETVSFSNQFMSFARSEGSGAGHAGFADALSSAFFLDTASDVAVPPIRRAPPIETNVAPQNEDGTFGQKPVIGGTAGPRRAPLLLVPQGAVPEATATYLGEIYSEPGRTSDDPAAENHGGFGFVFGGEAAVARATELALAQLLSGGAYTVAEDGPGVRTDLVPSMAPPQIFYTSLSYDGYTTPAGRGVSARGAYAEGAKICATGGALKGAQWLAAYDTGAFAAAGDVDYLDGVSRFFCFDAAEVGSARAQVLAFSLSGHETAPATVDWSGNGLSLDPPASDDKADTVTNGGNLTAPNECTDPAGLICSGGGDSSATFSGVTDIDFRGTSYSDAPWTLTMNFKRDPDTDVITYTGTFTVRDGTALLFSASVSGESATQASPFKFAGMYTTGQGKGGMRATVTTPADDNFVLTDLVLEGTA
ncbi:MAG TPA: cell wall-binding repeat-containing protein [Acidimicrobiales bacterium]|nr:cell wall-binding repeat-containing protein [Acidimicrobiales bacterium]